MMNPGVWRSTGRYAPRQTRYVAWSHFSRYGVLSHGLVDTCSIEWANQGTRQVFAILLFNSVVDLIRNHRHKILGLSLPVMACVALQQSTLRADV